MPPNTQPTSPVPGLELATLILSGCAWLFYEAARRKMPSISPICVLVSGPKDSAPQLSSTWATLRPPLVRMSRSASIFAIHVEAVEFICI